MNTSQFMDKQILGLAGSQSQSIGSGTGGGELFDLMTPTEDHQMNGAATGKRIKEDIVPSYDFQPIRAVGSSSPPTSSGLDGSRLPAVSSSWGASMDSKLSSNLKNAGILEPHELRKVSHEKERISYDGAIVSEIESIVKKHADTLLHALEGLSSRLSQLESRTHHLEGSVDELMVTVGNNNGSTDGKLRQLENVLREVQTGVQVLRDKQEIVETQLQLAKLQSSKNENKQSEDVSTGHSEAKQQQGPPPQHIQQTYQSPVTPAQPTMHPALPAQNAPPPPPPQQSQPQPQYPPQLPQPQIPSVPPLPREAYFPTQIQATDATHQQYQTPVQQPPQQLPPPPPPQHYQSAPQLPPYPQPSQSQHGNLSPQLQPPAPHHPEESALYMPPPQPYPPSIRQPAPPFPQGSGGPPPQQFFGANSTMYEPPANKLGSGQTSYSSGYGPPMGPGFSEAYPYSGSPSRHSSSAMKPSPFSSSAPSDGSGNYPRLPTAQILPQALPTASSSSSSSGAKVPIDDVVEKVATMGFSREQVRATVRKLTENGQSVDLNVVLDKLMNDGKIQPQKGWFGR